MNSLPSDVGLCDFYLDNLHKNQQMILRLGVFWLCSSSFITYWMIQLGILLCPFAD